MPSGVGVRVGVAARGRLVAAAVAGGALPARDPRTESLTAQATRSPMPELMNPPTMTATSSSMPTSSALT